MKDDEPLPKLGTHRVQRTMVAIVTILVLGLGSLHLSSQLLRPFGGLPPPLIKTLQAFAPLKLANGFGLFAVMTTELTVFHIDSKIALQLTLVHHVLLYTLALITQSNNELLKSIMGVMLHNMPQDRPATDFNQRFGFFTGLFGQT